jgi:uncharacterized DUF497 family protein
MEYLRFEWDENKNTINKAKHKVSFELSYSKRITEYNEFK